MEKRNDTFSCQWCGKEVLPALKTSRNHCNTCFLCVHVDDELPWDRMSTCKKPMVPFEYMVANGKIKVHFICTACGHTHRNKTAGDDAIACLDEKIKFWKKKYPHISWDM